MPRVRPLTQEGKFEYQKVRVAEKCELLMRRSGLKRKDIAAFVGCTPQNISNQLCANDVSLDVLMAVVTLSHADVKELEVLRVAE